MPTHSKIDDATLARWIEGESTPDEERDIERILSGDPTLEAEARVLRDQTRLLGRAPAHEMPPDLSARVMREVGRSGPPSRVYAFLFRPRTLTVRIATAASAAAALAAAVALVMWALPDGSTPATSGACMDAGTKTSPVTLAPDPPPDTSPARDADSRQVVFSVPASEARHVVLVGDFNAWDEEGTPLVDEDGDGVWTLEMAVPPGRYQYRLLADGDRWIDDPEADAQSDDGFGGSNSIRYVL